jgi:hypothetical protein
MTCLTIGSSASGLALALMVFLCRLLLKAFGRGTGATQWGVGTVGPVR